MGPYLARGMGLAPQFPCLPFASITLAAVAGTCVCVGPAFRASPPWLVPTHGFSKARGLLDAGPSLEPAISSRGETAGAQDDVTQLPGNKGHHGNNCLLRGLKVLFAPHTYTS